jgi:hypothetical protein
MAVNRKAEEHQRTRLKEERTMNDQNKTVNPEETPKDKKLQLTDDEAENAAGGAGWKKIEKPVFSKTPLIRKG